MDNIMSFICCPMKPSVSSGTCTAAVGPSTSFWSRMSCNECNVKFTVFKRKRICAECGHLYCINCLKKIKGIDEVLRCQCCRTFASLPLSRVAVSELKIRHLRAFLEANEVSIDGCKEKMELVDLIMQHMDVQNAYPQNYERHTERLEDVSDHLSTPSEDGARYMEMPHIHTGLFSHPFPAENSAPAEHISQMEVDDDIDVEGFAFVHVPELSASHPRESEESSHQSDTTDTEEARPDLADGANEEAKLGDRSPLTVLSIKDIKSPDEIPNLSVMQLKLILTRNFVSYKGCCEKHELQQQVLQLWKKKQEFKNTDAIDDENLCKICMEAPIDAVLLDCGHLVSCTECSKRLSECPICRKYVVRVVHTFKA